jgi:hypothetical protein
LTSKTNIAKKITALNYHFELFDQMGKEVESGNFQFDHKLWSPGQIKDVLMEAGFEVETVCLPFRFDLAATDVDWKIMFVCTKMVI